MGGDFSEKWWDLTNGTLPSCHPVTLPPTGQSAAPEMMRGTKDQIWPMEKILTWSASDIWYWKRSYKFLRISCLILQCESIEYYYDNPSSCPILSSIAWLVNSSSLGFQCCHNNTCHQQSSTTSSLLSPSPLTSLGKWSLWGPGLSTVPSLVYSETCLIVWM